MIQIKGHNIKLLSKSNVTQSEAKNLKYIKSIIEALRFTLNDKMKVIF